MWKREVDSRKVIGKWRWNTKHEVEVGHGNFGVETGSGSRSGSGK
jgi:hypothetical protein